MRTIHRRAELALAHLAVAIGVGEALLDRLAGLAVAACGGRRRSPWRASGSSCGGGAPSVPRLTRGMTSLPSPRSQVRDQRRMFACSSAVDERPACAAAASACASCATRMWRRYALARLILPVAGHLEALRRPAVASSSSASVSVLCGRRSARLQHHRHVAAFEPRTDLHDCQILQLFKHADRASRGRARDA